MKTDLSLVPVNDLVLELQKRCDGSVIIYEVSHHGTEHLALGFSGSMSAAIGLCERAKSMLLQSGEMCEAADMGDVL